MRFTVQASRSALPTSAGHRLLAAGTNDSALGIALRAFAIKLSETE
jgi:hypothetical protein